MSVVNYSGMMCYILSIHALVTVSSTHVKLTTGKNARQAYLYICLFTSISNLMLNYFHVC